MSVLQNIDNIKIPYPTEGVIRTAQLDDTIAPVNSVQLAVNMNFDRVGALQTRPGVTSYADTLAEAITNYGTLRNSLLPPGYDSIFQLGTTDEIVSTKFLNPVAVKINDTKIAVFWTDASGHGACRNFSVDEATGLVQAIGTQLAFDASAAGRKAAILMDTNIVLLAYQGAAGDGFANGFDCSGNTISMGPPYEFDTSDCDFPALAKVNSTHAICFYESTTGDGIATIFALSSTTVTEPGSPLTFESTLAEYNSCVALGDGTHFVNFWGHPGYAQCFEVNTGTWAITALDSPNNYSSTGTQNHAMSCFDGEHIVNCNLDNSGNFGAQTFEVDLGTYAVTEVGTPVVIKAGGGNDLNAVGFGDGKHFVAFYSVNVGDGFVQMFERDSLTNDLTLIADKLEGYDFGIPDNTWSVDLTDTKVLVVWGVGSGSTQGNAAMFTALGDLVNGQYLYAGHGDEVSNLSNQAPNSFTTDAAAATDIQTLQSGTCASLGILNGNPILFTSPSHDNFVNGTTYYAGAVSGNTFKVYSDPALTTLVAVTIDTAGYDWDMDLQGVWVVRRSGLAEVSKPRFVQYLNYIWMVNGNEQIGGDPVATSSGGNFGTDLVPDEFPKGDFISAGFEGRVWVANKTLGIIYYTDIVQFQPPAQYVLTYNPQVNFISTLAPQTGESFTALFEVPRALLVFTENTITRIYGASSVDAYPAYNVGTFSQESIIETKTGIFFHHSSGFYQFDYGSQPVEISRRIIDFVKAIPRSYYEDITGVWDGFDNVEWNVGQVVVEGVVFANCYVRYTISTQVWTIYDYGFITTANIYYDDGTNINHLVGTSTGLTGALDTGTTDFTQPFYFEFIDRWRAFTEMYYQTKQLSGFSVYSENAAGANLMYQKQKSGPNAWETIGTINSENTSLLPNSTTDDFDVLRLRIAGNTKGAQVVIHGIEILSLNLKGQDQN